MPSEPSVRAAARYVLPSAALVVAAAVVALGFLQSRRADRFVTVKGVAEAEVEADLAVWPLAVSVTADDLGAAQRAVDQALVQVRDFLERFGVGAESLIPGGTQVTDRVADRYNQIQPGQMRYIVSSSMSIRSTDLNAVDGAYRALGDLIGADVPVATPGGYGELRPTYVFTRLNEVKPEMIAQATASAREAAEQFAADSGSRLGGIRRANQGVFQVLSRTPGVPEPFERFKQVRVVSTIEYYLDD